jgi:fumarate hydratase class II
VLVQGKVDLIERVADEAMANTLDAEFPLYVWKTCSGTQTSMNVNEVISSRAIPIVGGALGSKSPIHLNDDVDMPRSSRDTLPTAMHIAAGLEMASSLLPAWMRSTLQSRPKAEEWQHIVKIGRTHLQHAVPLPEPGLLCWPRAQHFS